MTSNSTKKRSIYSVTILLLVLVACLWVATIFLFTTEQLVSDLKNADIGNGNGVDGRIGSRGHKLIQRIQTCQSGYVLDTQVGNGDDVAVTSSDRCVPCPSGSFSYPGWLTCRPYLTCDDLAGGAVRIARYLASGAIKHVFLGHYTLHSSIPVAYAVSNQHPADFQNHITVLKDLAPSPLVVQLLGHCQDKYVVTQYWKLGHCGNLEELLAHRAYAKFNNLAVRFRLAVDFVSCLAFLHEHDYVMCDGNDVAKLLSQFLITDEWHLVLNDLDAAAKLPRIDSNRKGTIKCGHKRLHGGVLVAPEQLWPFGDTPFKDGDMPGYDEKIDVWRIPPVVEVLIGSSLNGSLVLSDLNGVFKRCRLARPGDRPAAAEVLRAMLDVQERFHLLHAQPDDCE